MQATTWQRRIGEAARGLTTGPRADRACEAALGVPAGPTTAGALVACGVFLLLVADLPNLTTSAWALRYAVLGILGAAGLPPLFVRAWRGDGAARAGVGFLAAGALSMAGAPRPALSLLGLFDQGNGWLFLVATAGCWALGTQVGPTDRPLVEKAVVGAAGVNAAVIVLQQVVGLGAVGLGSSTPDGLLGNPVFAAGLLAGSLALVGPRAVASPRRWAPVALLLAVGVGISGERLSALLAVAVGVAVAVAAWSGRWAGAAGDPPAGRAACRRRGVRLAATVLAGVLGGSLLARATGGTGVVAHTAGSTASETLGKRLEVWRGALEAMMRRPLLGYGPGQFRAATLPYFTPGQRASLGSTVFTDAHNLFFETGATVGLVGLALLCTWLALAARHRRGALAGLAAVALVVGLAEPENVALTPLAFFALGAASMPGRRGSPGTPGAATAGTGGGRDRGRRGRRLQAAQIAGALVAAVPAGAFLAGDIALAQGDQQIQVAQIAAATTSASRAETLLAAWPEPATLEARVEFYIAIGDRPSAAPTAARWAAVAAARDPGNPSLEVAAAQDEASAGELAAARKSALAAIAVVPDFVPAMNMLGAVAALAHQDALSRQWYERSLAAAPDQPAVKALLAGACPAGGAKGASGLVRCAG